MIMLINKKVDTFTIYFTFYYSVLNQVAGGISLFGWRALRPPSELGARLSLPNLVGACRSNSALAHRCARRRCAGCRW